MRTILISSMILVFIMTSCEKNQGFMSQGIITKPDFRKCMCCGGFFIDIEDSVYRFDQWPDDFTFNWETDTFPIEVYLNWQIDSILCLGDEILVSRMRRKD